MAWSGNVTPFFNLPLELREQVYKEVLKSPTQGPELLRTCQRINTEAHKFLYQRPIRIPGQLYLYSWVASAPDEFLPQVTDMCLTIQDVDLRPLLDLNTATSRPTLTGRLRTWDMYAAELHKLKTALSKLPNVNTISIKALPGRQSYLYRDFLAEVLDSLCSVHPNLSDLSLEGDLHHHSLVFVKKLARLRSFSFDGLSASSSTEMAGILSSLEHLSSLSINTQHRMLARSSLIQSEFTGKTHPFTGEAMRTVEQLVSLSVTVRPPMYFTNLFFTPEVSNAVQHHKALKSLAISLSRTPDDNMLGSLGQCLGSSVIERLELDWPQLTVETIKMYALVPGCCKTLGIRVRSTDDALEILAFLLERQARDLKKLREVVLIRAARDFNAFDTAMYDRKDSGCVMDGEGSYIVSLSVPLTNYNKSLITCFRIAHKIN
jgi:hypothetical protein